MWFQQINLENEIGKSQTVGTEPNNIMTWYYNLTRDEYKNEEVADKFQREIGWNTK